MTHFPTPRSRYVKLRKQKDALKEAGLTHFRAEGVAHNMVTVLRAKGMSAQEAFDHIGELLRECYRDWYLAQARLRQWGEDIDFQVHRYIAALHSILLGSLHWQ